MSLAETPDERHADDATFLLQSRADLVLWLAPNRATRHALGAILRRLEIRLSNRLLVRAEIDAFDPPVRSPVTSAPAYLDREVGLLHLRSTTGRVDWAAAFRALFAEVERFCPTVDVPPLCLTAAYIMSLDEWAEAEQALRASDFKAPCDEDDGIEAGRALEDEAAEYTDEPRDGDGTAANGHAGEDNSENDAAPRAGGTHEAGGGHDHRGSDAGEDSQESRRGSADRRPTSERGADGEEGHVGGAAAQVPEDLKGADALDDEEPEDEDYGSASSRGQFGAELAGPATGVGDVTGVVDPRTAGERTAIASNGASRNAAALFQAGGSRTSENNAERQVRRSRMLSYVSRSGSRGDGDAASASAGDDITALIDAAAMKAALGYERARGWDPEQQPQFNPGFDVVSKSSGGGRRLIEVKGLENEWTERGIKLTHVQFAMAREHPDEFWIYVVEHARDLRRQRITAIGNPFGKVAEYWFDHNWRESSEEGAASRQIHLKVGLEVRHHLWGKGVVVEIQSRGAIPFVVVDFGALEGRRGVPFNSSLSILD